MRVLIILCLAAVTCASPAGYNYEPATAEGGLSEDDLGTRSGKDNDESDSETFAIDLRSGGSDNDEFNDETAASDVSLNTAALEAIEADESNAYEQQADQPTESQETQQTYDSAAVSDYEETQQNSYSEPASDYEQTSASENENTAAEPGIDKEFYTFEANEEDFNDPAAKAQLSDQLHQSLSVIFVKGPEQSILDDAAVGLAKQTADQNTDIYVLDQQADIDALTNSLNALGSSKNNKPEVSFVKYRTTEDAGNAVAAIEAEYESRGGTTQTHDGEVAETLDFASKRPVDSYGGEPSAPAAEYLPASIFRF